MTCLLYTSGAGTDVIRIKGVEKLHRTEYSIIPDQIEAGTFMFAAAATGGDITVKNAVSYTHLMNDRSDLKEGKMFINILQRRFESVI